MEPYFESMAGAKADRLGPRRSRLRPPAPSFVVGGAEVFVDLAEHIDIEAEIARKTKELARLEARIAGKERQLANANFVARAPADVIEKERAALAQLEDAVRGRATLAALEGRCGPARQ